MWRNQSGDQSFLTPLAEAPLPTPTNEERSPQPGKVAGWIRGDCGMPLSVSVFLLLVSLCLFPHCLQGLRPCANNNTYTQRVGWCCVQWGPPVFALLDRFHRWNFEKKGTVYNATSSTFSGLAVWKHGVLVPFLKSSTQKKTKRFWLGVHEG